MNALEQQDRDSGTWKRLKVQLEEELATQRVRNDSVNLTPEQTAATRGRIALIKEILALGNPPAPEVSP